MTKIAMFITFLFVQLTVFPLLEINIPRTNAPIEREEYFLDLLKLVLDKSKIEYQINITSRVYNQKRIINEFSKEISLINLYWMGTSTNFEEVMQAIRFPLMKGLLGYRIFIINKEKQSLFDEVKSLEDLQNLIGVQGHGWSDTEILENSGLEQYEMRYDTIYKFINSGRNDYFSRTISEVFFELESYKKDYENLCVEENLLLVYPFSMFFFTNKTNIKFKEIIEQGLIEAYNDGSFDTFFYNHPLIIKMMKDSKFESRLRIDIPNPLLSDRTRDVILKYGL